MRRPKSTAKQRAYARMLRALAKLAGAAVIYAHIDDTTSASVVAGKPMPMGPLIEATNVLEAAAHAYARTLTSREFRKRIRKAGRK